MAEPVGPRQGGGDGSGDPRVGAWPSQPSAPPSAPSWHGHEISDAPTEPEPELAPTDELVPAPTTESPAPFFHDVAGPPPPGSGPFGPVDQGPGGLGSGQPGYPPPYGYPPYGGSPYGPYAYGTWSPPKNNGLAIASMVCGICAFALCQIFAIPGLILGLRARRQIRESGGAETGDPFALAGIILSSIGVFLLVAIIAVYVVVIGVTVASGV